MFDVKHGAELADTAYEQVMMREDVSLWYAFNYYSKNRSWERAVNEVLISMSDDDLTDLMAWTAVQPRTTDGYATLPMAWRHGFGYLFGSLLASRYEDENTEKE